MSGNGTGGSGGAISVESTLATGTGTETLWQINLLPRAEIKDRLGEIVQAECTDAGIGDIKVDAARGFLVQGRLSARQIEQIAKDVFADTVVEEYVIGRPGDDDLNRVNLEQNDLFYVLPKPGVTDPEAETALFAVRQLGFEVSAIRTLRRFITTKLDREQIGKFEALLANNSIESLVSGPLQLNEIQLGQPYQFELRNVELLKADDDQLQAISKKWQLSLTLVEMQTIQQHYQKLDRDPTDAELETIAQTWSEHCSHKTLAGRVEYKDENGVRNFDNMLKETVFAATQTIRKQLGDDDWCVSVFKDNAGIVTFDEEFNVTFKVETHNRPSAIEPYGGANTGIGGVIRDTMGTGLGAKPVCNTDVFCFAPPTTKEEDLPPGVLHPRRVMNGVVAGVRDYGNRMGIPTVNGAVFFDDRYVGNPLVFCGNVGILPKDKSFKEPQPNDLIVAIGGRTGRDGIHGATFSSVELTDKSEIESGGAVQIGNAITEKMVLDVLLQARDAGLYTAVTDCGAGGFSSAVGEMGEELGAEVWLEKAPLKYEGLSYTEIWISEAQERMVFSVPESNWEAFEKLCSSESVEATVIGRFVPTGMLTLKYDDQQVAELSMEFLHNGRPPIVRSAVYEPPGEASRSLDKPALSRENIESSLTAILGSLNVASKHWIIRQYDHEVLAGSVVKPLVGIQNDGPSDASVIRPHLRSQRGLAISCGMNPHFGDVDPYHMAASGIDEAIRNCVAVGADPNRIAILDNFCWGYTDRPETLGTLVRAAIACHDVAIEYKTPFISGKDSLNNEFSFTNSDGDRETISIPSTLLISAMGQVDDVGKCVTMDLKSTGNAVFLIGQTKDEFGGSHYCLVNELTGGKLPEVDAVQNRDLYLTLHQAIGEGLVRSCHDLSEGGLAVAAAEMGFAGGLGIEIQLDAVCERSQLEPLTILFSESNGRLLCEVAPENIEKFEAKFGDHVCRVGEVVEDQNFKVLNQGQLLAECSLGNLKTAWQTPLDWD